MRCDYGFLYGRRAACGRPSLLCHRFQIPFSAVQMPHRCFNADTSAHRSNAAAVTDRRWAVRCPAGCRLAPPRPVAPVHAQSWWGGPTAFALPTGRGTIPFHVRRENADSTRGDVYISAARAVSFARDDMDRPPTRSLRNLSCSGPNGLIVRQLSMTWQR